MNSKHRQSIIFFSLIFLTTVTPHLLANQEAVSASPEFRAAWASRFGWPDADPEKCRGNIVRTLDNLEKVNLNAIVFQVRGQADVLYPSQYEPWSPLIGGKDPGWDPLAFAIEQAHSRGIQLHSYVNPIPMWQGKNPPPHSTPKHMYHLHGPETEESWVCHDAEGKPMTGAGEYIYFSPGVPGVQAHIRKVLIDLVTRYDLDGIHYDRIRYPGPKYSHDPISEKRFKGNGNPKKLRWEDWQRDQLNKLINDLYAQIAEVKPWLVVSCAAWGIHDRNAIPGYDKFSSGYHDYYQDTVTWVHQGGMDVLMPMMYWNIPDPKPNWDELADYFVGKVGREHWVGGMRGRYGADELIAEIQYARKKGGLGTVVWGSGSMTGDEGREKFLKSVYKEKAPIPELPWKTNPKHGILSGWVIDQSGNPIEDAFLELKGHAEKWTSGADGFFAFLKVNPGKHTLKISVTGSPDRVYSGLEVSTGAVTSLKCTPLSKEAKTTHYRIITPRRQ